jgi:hypothetical protein
MIAPTKFMTLSPLRAFLVPKIGVGNLVARQSSGVAFDDNAAFQHAHHSVRNLESPLQVLLDKQNGCPRRDKGFDRFVDKIDRQRRQSERNLIEQQQARIGHQRPSDRSCLLLAAGKRAATRLAPRLEHRKGVHYAIDRPFPAASAGARDLQVLLDRHRSKETASLRHRRYSHCYTPVGWHSRNVQPLELDLTT